MQFRLFALLRIYLIAGLEQLIMELNVIGKYIYFIYTVTVSDFSF